VIYRKHRYFQQNQPPVRKSTLREVLPYIGKKKNGNHVETAGSQSVDFWKLNIQQSVSSQLTPYLQENRQVLGAPLLLRGTQPSARWRRVK